MQHIAGHFQRREKGFSLILNAEIHELMHVTPVAGAGVDWHVREMGFDQFDRLERLLNVVDRQHEGPRLASLRSFENRKLGGIAEITLVAELIDELNLTGIGSSAVNGMPLAVRMRPTT